MTTHPVRNQRARWALIISVGTALTLAVAGLAAMTRGDDPWLTFVVFAAATSPIIYGGAWVLVPDPGRVDPVTHLEDTVEHAWSQLAASGAFLDLITAMGLALAVQSVLGTNAVPHAVFLGLGIADFSVRYAVLRRRAA